MSRFSRTVMRGKQRRPSGDCEMPSWTMSAGGMRVMFSPSKTDVAGARRRQARDRAQRRRLAGAVGADQRDALALLDGQRDALERLDVAVVGVDVVDLEHRHQLTTASSRWRSASCLPR